ncbi:hypothetical protein HPB51_014666 [Rhipicephalus microplus]|uniref:Uncharacterized protein n=1 Tax=Rhipicephalus microplus TaxID=6941 RepID=A0A9J6F486_RHIMP|nr:hypothetical protein HPB51_014666 [Rhipicephalus microplus]
MLSQVRTVLLAAALLQSLGPGACDKNGCAPTPVEELRERLGPAFNARYMSIDKPPKEEDPVRIYPRHTESVWQSDGPHVDRAKLDPQAHPSFRVDPDFVQDVVNDGHANTYEQIQSASRRRRESKRKAEEAPQVIVFAWKGAPIGQGESCWFTHFECKGRAFTVNVLRRLTAQPVCEGERASSDSLPQDLREEWVFEERAVTFCCDCTAPTSDD